MVSKKLKTIPAFENEEQEAQFWNKHDSTDYIDWNQAVRIKPKTKLISIRLPESLLKEIKDVALDKSLPYQALIRTWLTEKIKEAK